MDFELSSGLQHLVSMTDTPQAYGKSASESPNGWSPGENTLSRRRTGPVKNFYSLPTEPPCCQGLRQGRAAWAGGKAGAADAAR